jgi:hypothetical protein
MPPMPDELIDWPVLTPEQIDAARQKGQLNDLLGIKS